MLKVRDAKSLMGSAPFFLKYDVVYYLFEQDTAETMTDEKQGAHARFLRKVSVYSDIRFRSEILPLGDLGTIVEHQASGCPHPEPVARRNWRLVVIDGQRRQAEFAW